MDASLERFIRQRAGSACEYCRFPQARSVLPFEIDHIIARPHGGLTHTDHLALACFFCNRYKGPNLAGIDPVTGAIVPLFHPRRQKWKRHFRWEGPVLVGRTRSGRATIAVLRLNDLDAIGNREILIANGFFPPP